MLPMWRTLRIGIERERRQGTIIRTLAGIAAITWLLFYLLFLIFAGLYWTL
jgi:hypothetical protein